MQTIYYLTIPNTLSNPQFFLNFNLEIKILFNKMCSVLSIDNVKKMLNFELKTDSI